MLGRTAGGLFWMFRYLERAENLARLIDAGLRISLTRSGDNQEDWNSILKTAAVLQRYSETYSTEINLSSATNWLLRDKMNSSSVLISFEAARNNARMVRTALTREVWEAVNEAWMLITHALSRKVAERDLPRVLHLIRERVAYVRGSFHGTMLRNEIFNFSRIGTYLERADSTARILDVKYYVLLPSAKAVGTSIDNVQWETILRSVSAYGGFRLEYGHEAGPSDIAKFLILDKRMPRSLIYCCDIIKLHLLSLCSAYRNKPPSLLQIIQLQNRFLTHDIDAVFKFGLHDFLQKMISLFGNLSNQIEIDYRFYE